MEKKLGTKIAVAGVGIAAIAGLAIASPALAANSNSKASSTSSSSSAPNFSMKGGADGDHGRGMKGGKHGQMTSQSITVNVPADGGTYMLVITEAAPTLPAGVTPPTDANGNPLPAPKAHSQAIAITGTGTQTVTVPGIHPGKFTAQLVKVTGDAVNGEVGTDGKLVAPITIG